jgi:hypothetical protein
LGLTCQHVINVATTGYCRKQLPESTPSNCLEPRLKPLHRWVTYPRSRIITSSWYVTRKRLYRSLGKHWSRGQTCSLRSCLGWRRRAKNMLRVPFFGRSDSSHVRMRFRRLDCAVHYASSLSLYSRSPSMANAYLTALPTIYTVLAAHADFYKKS